jgi:hypothetical protein
MRTDELGGLTLDDRSTFSAWNLHAFLLAMPVGPSNEIDLPGKDLFPLELSVRLKSFHLVGPERLYVGLMDPLTFHNVASVSIGLQGFDRVPTTSHTGDKILSQLAIGPAVSLVRAEEPQYSGDIVLASKIMPELANADIVELKLRVNANGEYAAVGTISSGTKVFPFALNPNQLSPDSFVASRSKLDPTARFVPVIYAQTLPSIAVFSISRAGGSSSVMSDPQTIPLVIHGQGFGLDSTLELIPEGDGMPAIATELSIGRDCLTLKAKVKLPVKPAKSYTVRVTSGGNTVTLPGALPMIGQS